MVKHAYERVFTTTRDGRTCSTVTIGKETILPPGAELLVLILMLDVNGKGKGDLSFTVSVGSRNGPGAAQTLTSLVTSLMVRVRTTHSTMRVSPPDKQLNVELSSNSKPAYLGLDRHLMIAR